MFISQVSDLTLYALIELGHNQIRNTDWAFWIPSLNKGSISSSHAHSENKSKDRGGKKRFIFIEIGKEKKNTSLVSYDSDGGAHI